MRNCQREILLREEEKTVKKANKNGEPRESADEKYCSEPKEEIWKEANERKASLKRKSKGFNMKKRVNVKEKTNAN